MSARTLMLNAKHSSISQVGCQLAVSGLSGHEKSDESCLIGSRVANSFVKQMLDFNYECINQHI